MSPTASEDPGAVTNLVIYEVFVRNHGPHGTFADVGADLERIRALGTDIVWFMPIHPIGAVARKGSLGSPYSIADYGSVNPAYGTREDFVRLVDRIHSLGMRVMIDVVYNHTAHDSRLVAEHPDFFHQDDAGRPVTTTPEWSDVIDLRHGDPGLTEELVSTLEGWLDLGVDGFRCDVASLVPATFWRQAIDRVAARKPGVVWLAENVYATWVGWRRTRGLWGSADAELYVAGFDLTYDYDIWSIFQAAVRGDVPVARYLEMIRFQSCVLPTGFAKMRCVENHDQPRIQQLAPDAARARAWTAFAAFQAGAFLIHAGQESGSDHVPSLFEHDPVDWAGYPLQGFLERLGALKKEPALVRGEFHILAAEPAIQVAWVAPDGNLYGVFSVGGASGQATVQLPDGDYHDLLTDALVGVRGGTMTLPTDAAILRVDTPLTVTPMTFDLLDYQPADLSS
jgi:glycosidase